MDVTSNRLHNLPKELGFLQGRLTTLQLDSNPLPLEIIVRSIDVNEVLTYLKAQAEGKDHEIDTEYSESTVKSLFDICVLFVLANKALFSAKLGCVPKDIAERLQAEQTNSTKVSQLLRMVRSSTAFY